MDSYHKKRILITGGLGFIGSNLARELVRQGAEVSIVDNLWPDYGGNLFNIAGIENQLTVDIADVRDSSAMEALIKGKDFLFNLAGQTSHVDSMSDPHTDLEINTVAQLSILEACRKTNPTIRVVFASTRQIYGKPDYLPVDEFHPVRPVDVNGINKLAGEWYHLLYYNVYGIRSTVLRLTNTYGPGMRVKDARQTFLGIWIKSILETKPITVFGSGNQLRDFTYVDDCIEALLLAGASEKAAGLIFNLGSDEVVSLKDLAQLLVDLDPTASVEFLPFPANRQAIDIGDYFGDFSKISKELGWLPKVGLREGLARTVNYFRKHAMDYCD